MRLENLIEDHPMTAPGNVPCNVLPRLLSPQRDPTDARARRPDLDLQARGCSYGCRAKGGPAVR